MDSCFILLIVAVQYTPFASPKQNAEKWYASFLFLGVMTIVFRDSPVSMRIKDLLLFYSSCTDKAIQEFLDVTEHDSVSINMAIDSVS